MIVFVNDMSDINIDSSIVKNEVSLNHREEKLNAALSAQAETESKLMEAESRLVKASESFSAQKLEIEKRIEELVKSDK